MAVFDVRSWLARARRSKLSTRVTVLFIGAFFLPWGVYAWLTVTGRAEQMLGTEHNLAALAAAYGEHAAALMRLGVAVPIDGDFSNNSTERGAAEMTAFRSALNADGIKCSLHGPGKTSLALHGPDAAAPSFDNRNGVITAQVNRPAAGFAATASMSEDEALKEWQARADAGAITLLLRSLF